MEILAIGAHPDDVELGCGGTLARHVKEGDRVRVVFLTKGEVGGDPSIRIKESKEAIRVLGVESPIFGNLSDTFIHDSIKQTIDLIEYYVDKFSPDRVYTHSTKDRHQDHVGASIATQAACRNVSEILMYETPATFAEFSPQVYINIEGTLDLKVKALRSHSTQKNKYYMRAKAIKGLAEFRGFQANLKAAEAFEVARVIYK
ncbi:MAG: PIG-L deacetylase family protein [Candidatus Hydrothermarchaeota archaeon]